MTHEDILTALRKLDDDAARLELEFGGCKELCRKVVEWTQRGQKFVDALEGAAVSLDNLLADTNKLRDELRDRLNGDPADWWK